MSEPREIPILRNAAQVRAILNGATQIRVPVKHPERLQDLMLHGEEAEWGPFGGPGDLLYVKETWRPIKVQGGSGMYAGTISDHIEYRANEDELNALKCVRASSGLSYVGEPDNYASIFADAGYWSSRCGGSGPWRSSTQMPKWACRIWRRVTRVWMQQVQEISPEDCVAEGCSRFGAEYLRLDTPFRTPEGYLSGPQGRTPEQRREFVAFHLRGEYRESWDFCYAKKHPWASNPCVFGCEVERAVTPPGKEVNRE